VGSWVRRHRALSVSSVFLVVLIAVVALVATGGLSSSSQQVLHLGQPGRSGPLLLTPLTVRCDKTRKDLPRDAREMAPASLPGRFCLVSIRVENVSQFDTPPQIEGVLYVGEDAFPDGTTVPVYFTAGPPGFVITMTMVFNLPEGQVPTRLQLAALSPVRGPPQGGILAYNLQGLL